MLCIVCRYNIAEVVGSVEVHLFIYFFPIVTVVFSVSFRNATLP